MELDTGLTWPLSSFGVSVAAVSGKSEKSFLERDVQSSDYSLLRSGDENKICYLWNGAAYYLYLWNGAAFYLYLWNGSTYYLYVKRYSFITFTFETVQLFTFTIETV